MQLDTTNIGTLYGPAMEITEQNEADQYFALLVEHINELLAQEGQTNHTSMSAEQIVRSNLGYMAGYYSHETQQRVNRLFKTTHPIFGSAQPTAQETFDVGRKWASSAEQGNE